MTMVREEFSRDFTGIVLGYVQVGSDEDAFAAGEATGAHVAESEAFHLALPDQWLPTCCTKRIMLQV